jgi:hypothetical protein
VPSANQNPSKGSKQSSDPDSRMTNRWSAAFGNTGYKYDPLANLTNIAYPHSGTVIRRRCGRLVTRI